MTQFPLKFSYKGARDYIQGPDIFNETVRVLQSCAASSLQKLDFVFRQMTDANLQLSVLSPSERQDPSGKAIATVRFATAQGPWLAVLHPTDDKPAERGPYDEAQIVDRCRFDLSQQAASMPYAESPFSLMETLVSMNKALHKQVIPEATGQWVFCRWGAPQWPVDADGLEVRVRLVHKLGTQLTKAQATLGGTPIGHMYFAQRSVA